MHSNNFEFIPYLLQHEHLQRGKVQHPLQQLQIIWHDSQQVSPVERHLTLTVCIRLPVVPHLDSVQLVTLITAAATTTVDDDGDMPRQSCHKFFAHFGVKVKLFIAEPIKSVIYTQRAVDGVKWRQSTFSPFSVSRSSSIIERMKGESWTGQKQQQRHIPKHLKWIIVIKTRVVVVTPSRLPPPPAPGSLSSLSPSLSSSSCWLSTRCRVNNNWHLFTISTWATGGPAPP